MQTIQLKAHEVVDGKKVLVGEREIQLPDTVAELTENWDDETILACFHYGYRVREQADIKRDVDSPGKKNLRLFKKLSKADQDAILASYNLL